MPNRKRNRRNESHSDGAHRGQVLWTVCVALAVAFFALQHALGPNSEKSSTLIASPQPSPIVMRALSADSGGGSVVR